MQKLLLTIDKISTFVGHAFSWLIVALTLLITWEVFSRYVLDHPHPWAFDAMIMMYGTLIMMAGAYTLAKSGHVRGDVLYGFFRPRTQATIDLILYVIFWADAWYRARWAPKTAALYFVLSVLPTGGFFADRRLRRESEDAVIASRARKEGVVGA